MRRSCGKSFSGRRKRIVPERRPAAIRSAEYSVKEKPVSTRMDDNGVNVTEQSVEMIRNAYQLQYVMKSINSDLTVLKAAIQG